MAILKWQNNREAVSILPYGDSLFFYLYLKNSVNMNDYVFTFLIA